MRNGNVSGVPYSKQSFMSERPFFPQNKQTQRSKCNGTSTSYENKNTFKNNNNVSHKHSSVFTLILPTAEQSVVFCGGLHKSIFFCIPGRIQGADFDLHRGPESLGSLYILVQYTWRLLMDSVSCPAAIFKHSITRSSSPSLIRVKVEDSSCIARRGTTI